VRHREGRIELPIREAPQLWRPMHRMPEIACEGRAAKPSVFATQICPAICIKSLGAPRSLLTTTPT
jgi:hypothetical protein